MKDVTEGITHARALACRKEVFEDYCQKKFDFEVESFAVKIDEELVFKDGKWVADEERNGEKSDIMVPIITAISVQ